MAEYISREFMLKNLEVDKINNAEHCLPVTVQIMERFIRYVKEFPAADVQPVKRGRWECVGHDDTTYWYRCSVCGHEEHDNMTKHDKFCSSCGARMDGET